MFQRSPPRPPRPPAALSPLLWSPDEDDATSSKTAGLTPKLGDDASSNDRPSSHTHIHSRSVKPLPPLPLYPRKSPPGGIRGHAFGFKMAALGVGGSAPSPRQGSPPAAGRQSSRRASLNSLCATGHNSSKKVKQLTGCNIDVDDVSPDRFFRYSSPINTTAITTTATTTTTTYNNKNTKNTKNAKNNNRTSSSCTANNPHRRRACMTRTMPHTEPPTSAPLARMHQWRPSMDMDGGCGFFESSGASSRAHSWISVDSNRSSTSRPSDTSDASSRSSVDDEELAFEIRAAEGLMNDKLQAAAEYHMLVNEFTSGFDSLSLSLNEDFLPPPEAPKSFQNQIPDPSHHLMQQPPSHEEPRYLHPNSQPPAPRQQPMEQPSQSHYSDNLPRIELPLGYNPTENVVHVARGFSGRNSRRRAPPHAIHPPTKAPAPMIRSAVDMPVSHSAFDSDSDDDDLDSSGRLRELKTWLANEASPLSSRWQNYYHENLEGRYRSPGSFVPSSATPHMVADKLIGSAKDAVGKAKAKGWPRSSKKDSPMQIEFIGGGRVI